MFGAVILFDRVNTNVASEHATTRAPHAPTHPVKRAAVRAVCVQYRRLLGWRLHNNRAVGRRLDARCDVEYAASGLVHLAAAHDGCGDPRDFKAVRRIRDDAGKGVGGQQTLLASGATPKPGPVGITLRAFPSPSAPARFRQSPSDGIKQDESARFAAPDIARAPSRAEPKH